MSFEALAPHYRWMEWLLAGGKLQRCRTAYLSEVKPACRALLLGEGNGRFLGAFARLNRAAHITVLDASAAMLRQARQRVDLVLPRGPLAPIEYLCTDILSWSPPPRPFDLIVTNFFLDCFRPDQLAVIIPRLARATTSQADWFVSDFCIPSRGLARWRARGMVGAMYCFFRIATGLPARFLAPHDRLLTENGFQLRRSLQSEWGLLQAGWWRRERATDGPG